MSQLELIRNKVCSADAATATITEWRNSTECKIVFTNGCFDILHRGHIDYLSHAADMGTHLVIGINSDSSVQRLKGPSRPINDQQSRAEVIAALQFVKLVIVFGDDTPLGLISQLKPDVLVKGGDYQLNNIVGADVVNKYGGMVTTIPFVPGYSTSAIEKKIRESNF
jgi:D-glycero-beta-D-manno-heptose 1-phosphate adenylyltransferase